jgi:hypothetical protein
MGMKYEKGDYFLDKDTHKLYIFDGNEWWEIVPSSYLKKINYDK